MVGYFEGIDSEPGLDWRCADSLSLREFVRLGLSEPVLDHSWLSKTRARLPLKVHETIFAWVLQRLMEHGLIKGGRIGADASTMHVAGYNLGLIMRLLVGAGTPREFSASVSAHLLVLTAADTRTAILIVATGREAAMLVVSVVTEPHD